MKFILIFVTAIIVSVVFSICRDMAKTRGSEKSLRWTLSVGAVAIGAMWWGAYHFFGERPESEVKVSESVFSSYPKEQYPKTYKAWGDSGVREIQELERLAAVKAARQRECDNVYSIGLSEKYSRPIDRIVVFADCENGWRFYIDHNLVILDSKKVN